MSGHQSKAPLSTTWLTPPEIIAALGGWQSFDLDPCAAPEPRPWPTARRMNAEADGDGLSIEWDGRVWCNPPYTSPGIEAWLERLARHGRGLTLIFARTETEAFQRHVWQRAHGLLFIAGRLNFYRPDGRRAIKNAGAPSVIAAYGADDMDRLAASEIGGSFVPLRMARGLLISGLEPSWREAVAAFLRANGGDATLSEAYRYFARHPKARRNQHWQAKIRQQMQAIGRRIAPGHYQMEMAL